MSLLADKRVVVTGATGGLGRAIALACAREGAVVGLGYRSAPEQAREIAERIALRHDRPAFPLALDVTNPEAIRDAIAEFIGHAGGVDGWVNNAGVSHPSLMVTAWPDALRLQLEVNLLGPMLCARAVLPIMMRKRRGVIVNISSVAAVRPTRGQAAYAASKGGVEALTRALAVEYAKKGVRVVCLRAGPVNTAMLEATRVLGEEEILARTPQRRIALPGEVAEHAAFLLSDRAAFATGSVVTVDGGYQVG